MQVPLSLDIDRWTVVVFDLYEILSLSGVLPASYRIDNGYQIKSLILCANMHVRGVYTSDNLYDFVTMPNAMRFNLKGIELSQWPEHFAWLELPQDLRPDQK